MAVSDGRLIARFDTIAWKNPLTTPNHFDKSEFNAWGSGAGLRNLLMNLNANYPDQVYLTAHSMGNIVAGEALRLAGTNQIVNTYVAMQGAVASHAYDGNAPTRTIPENADDGTFNFYAHYWQSDSPAYFNGVSGAGTYVNFFNINDYALEKWKLDQDLKPADTLSYAYWQSSSTNFFTKGWILLTPLSFPTDAYEIFSFCDEAQCYALGAQANVEGVFKVGQTYNQIDLRLAPFSFESTHKGHSAQFRSTNVKRGAFCSAVLEKMLLQ